jgi:hypothetical protein
MGDDAIGNLKEALRGIARVALAGREMTAELMPGVVRESGPLVERCNVAHFALPVNFPQILCNDAGVPFLGDLTLSWAAIDATGTRTIAE